MNEGGNISREKFTYKLHDLWEFGLKNLMAISKVGGSKRGGITKVH